MLKFGSSDFDLGRSKPEAGEGPQLFLGALGPSIYTTLGNLGFQKKTAIKFGFFGENLNLIRHKFKRC
jgi:hypothetical protein